MQISVTEAKGRLNELVRRVEEVVLTRRGVAVVRLAPVSAAPDEIAGCTSIHSD